MRAAGLNSADILQLQGGYPFRKERRPTSPGLELAGEVAALGPGATRFAEGDRVMAVVAGGGQAELAVVHEQAASPVPEALDWPEAGGAPEVFDRPRRALLAGRAGDGGAPARPRRRGRRGRARRPSSSAGRRAPRSWRVVRNEALRDDVAGLGARAVAPEEFAELGPFDVVLELVGAPNLPENLKAALATDGRIAVIGVAGAGFKAELNLLALMGKQARIGSLLRPPVGGEGDMRAPRRAPRAAAVRLGRLARARRGDVPARRCRRGLRTVRGRRQARQDRAALPLILYDADCGLCRWTLAKVLAWDAPRPAARGPRDPRRRLSCSPG